MLCELVPVTCYKVADLFIGYHLCPTERRPSYGSQTDNVMLYMNFMVTDADLGGVRIVLCPL